jgi:maleylpyruvate isomerase
VTTALRAPAWREEGTRLLLGAVDRLSASELDAPTALPGWTRRHLVAHVGYNAHALCRLASWARTGEPSPMYASPEQRAAEIAAGAKWEAGLLRDFARASALALSDELASLDDEDWLREVVTAQGRTVRATEIPWMRTREVAVHAVDLETGLSFDDLPVDLCAALVADVSALRSKRGDGPALLLTSATGEAWHIHGHHPTQSVLGDPHSLARWLTGRGSEGLTTEDGRALPALGPWL